jgi:hypothetical protein
MKNRILELDKIKGDAKLVGNCEISEPKVIDYKDSNEYEIGNLLFCDTFAIIYDLRKKEKKEKIQNHFINSSSNCQYMTVKSGKWNLYKKTNIDYGYSHNNLIMVNNAIDINGFIFNDFVNTHACSDGCSVQILDISLVWLTPEMMDEIMKLHKTPTDNYLQFYKTYPIIRTGGDTGISMKCYKYNDEICAIYIE